MNPRMVGASALALLACLFPPGASAQTEIESDKVTFTSIDPVRFPKANNFELTIGGKFNGVPKSDVFPNSSILSNDPRGMARLSGAPLDNGGSANITFKSDAIRNAPAGFFTFTDATGKMTSISNIVNSKSLDGNNVAFNPAGGGYDATLDSTWANL